MSFAQLAGLLFPPGFCTTSWRIFIRPFGFFFSGFGSRTLLLFPNSARMFLRLPLVRFGSETHRERQSGFSGGQLIGTH